MIILIDFLIKALNYSSINCALDIIESIITNINGKLLRSSNL